MSKMFNTTFLFALPLSFGVGMGKINKKQSEREYTLTDCFFGDFAHWEYLYFFLNNRLFSPNKNPFSFLCLIKLCFSWKIWLVCTIEFCCVMAHN